jgi:deoxyribose-phosphate aldolase
VYYIIKKRKGEKKMNIYEHIDYTLLKPTATLKDIFNLCDNAVAKGCASVCIPSNYVLEVAESYEDLTVCTVVGFPLGNSTIETKVAETKQAIKDGAKEIDMVMNIGEFKGGNHYYLKEEINAIAEVMPKNAVLKVIIETCYLTTKEIGIATIIIDESLADYVKTSTGFGTRGASFEDIEIIKKNIHNSTKIKASGGIRTKEEMEKYIALGCDRIGASKLP